MNLFQKKIVISPVVELSINHRNYLLFFFGIKALYLNAKTDWLSLKANF